MSNETTGSDKRPRASTRCRAAWMIDLGETPTFGYYVGPAAKITAKAGSKTLTASRRD